MSAAEWIAKRRELLADATEGPWAAEYSSLHRDCVVPHDARSTREAVAQTRLLRAAGDAALIADARTSLPRALDALEAVLAPHQMHEVPGGQRWCLHCGGDWPCPTVDAAETALRGES